MGMYDALKDGIKIVQSTDNAPLLKNYIDIQNGYMALKEQLEEANNKIKDLEERLKNKEILTFNEKGYYEEKGSTRKICSRCYEVDNKVVSLYEDTMQTSGIYYVCPQCKNEVLKEKKEIGVPVASIKNMNRGNFPSRKTW